METKDIKNSTEIVANSIKPLNKYIERNLLIKTEEDKDACLRFLISNNKILTLCSKYYDIKYINTALDYSDCLIYFISQENHKDIVGFALIKSKEKIYGKILNILLLCSISDEVNEMIVYSLYNFAVKYKYSFLYVAPRTPELRKIFIKDGYESIHGIEGIDELLEKEI